MATRYHLQDFAIYREGFVRLPILSIYAFFGLMAVALTGALPAVAKPVCATGNGVGEWSDTNDCDCPEGFQKQIVSAACGFVGGTCTIQCLAKKSVGSANCPVSAELLENFKWIHKDAAHNKKSAVMQGNILRGSTVAAFDDNVDDIRKAYKQAQSHNGRVAALIDDCSDEGVNAVAYEFAEKYVRLKTCGESAPAESATCSDYTENLRWGLLNAAECSKHARDDIDVWSDQTMTLRQRAYYIRRGFKIAQGHARGTALSIDFIGDQLLVRLTRQVWDKYRVGDLEQGSIMDIDPNVCPGISLFDFFE